MELSGGHKIHICSNKVKGEIMKIPEYLKKESSHQTSGINTCSLTGLSLLWAHILGYISPWFLPLTIFCLMAGFGNEVRKRDA